jgi:hypothetical protein
VPSGRTGQQRNQPGTASTGGRETLTGLNGPAPPLSLPLGTGTHPCAPRWTQRVLPTSQFLGGVGSREHAGMVDLGADSDPGTR